MSPLVCVGCQTFLRLKQRGVGVEELMPDHAGSLVSYKLWAADLYGCDRCHTEIVANFGAGPVAEHFMPIYAETVARWQPIARVPAP